MLLYADDLESMGRGAKGRQFRYLYLAALGYPFKWAKTCGGFRVELGMETEYPTYKLGLSLKRGLALDRRLWFSLEGEKCWAPWAFAKGDPGKVIAALELLATLVGVQLWVPDGGTKKTCRVAIRGKTDNQSNEALLKKTMTTKFPSTLILMELAEELSAKNCELQLQWVRRDLNQLADDLTNENFASFDPN